MEEREPAELRAHMLRDGFPSGASRGLSWYADGADWIGSNG